MLTKQEAIKKYGWEEIWSFNNGDWSYYDEDDYDHLMRQIDGKWIELTEGIKTWEVHSHDNGDWSYEDEDGWEHLMRFIGGKWVELTEGMKVTDVWPAYGNDDWRYKDEKGEWRDVKFDASQYK
jgi:hypothetical protein